MLWKQNWQTWMAGEELAKSAQGWEGPTAEAHLVSTGTRSKVLVGEVKLLDAERTEAWLVIARRWVKLVHRCDVLAGEWSGRQDGRSNGVVLTMSPPHHRGTDLEVPWF